LPPAAPRAGSPPSGLLAGRRHDGVRVLRHPSQMPASLHSPPRAPRMPWRPPHRARRWCSCYCSSISLSLVPDISMAANHHGYRMLSAGNARKYGSIMAEQRCPAAATTQDLVRLNRRFTSGYGSAHSSARTKIRRSNHSPANLSRCVDELRARRRDSKCRKFSTNWEREIGTAVPRPAAAGRVIPTYPRLRRLTQTYADFPDFPDAA
jgi:hypothetical protein